MKSSINIVISRLGIAMLSGLFAVSPFIAHAQTNAAAAITNSVTAAVAAATASSSAEVLGRSVDIANTEAKDTDSDALQVTPTEPVED